MTRLLFWIALIILVVMAIRSKLRAAVAARGFDPHAGQGGAAPAGGTRPQARVEEVERMTSCAHCGLYFPASEAVHQGGQDYCCEAHARQPAASRIE
ncbi:PP0621 family protein [Massilia norwichensis]|uniref:PP0621 family protein n=1 Tax=Massilia norwichensis TaxID=1442366 RepID=A0ABT2A2Z8_9BURK|nr:PP0621 family protein [Massilia norwichensis]MCS0588566.1 PP0621 family protein [Massilia norwichensis]